MTVGGIVLCGGRSSRMGRPKAWLPVGGEVMLQRVVRVLREVVDPVVVVAAPGQDVPPLPDAVTIVRDEVEGRGPLAGLAAGLAALDGRADAAYLSACDVPFLSPAFVRRVAGFLEDPSPRSAPLLFTSPPLGREGEEENPRPLPPTPSPQRRGGGSPEPGASVLLPLPPRGRGPGGGVSCVVPRVGGYHHPLAAAYRLDVLPHVRDLLAADRLRPVFLFDAVPTRVVEAGELADIDPDLRSLRNLNTPEDYARAARDLV